jgi:hypothetical protein
MAKFGDSQQVQRLQSILDLPDNGTPEMAKAKKVAENKLGQLSTSYMAKSMGLEDPFRPSSEPKSKGGGGGGGAMPKSNRDITKNYKKGGSVSSASKRADGIAVKGKTRGRMI